MYLNVLQRYLLVSGNIHRPYLLVWVFYQFYNNLIQPFQDRLDEIENNKTEKQRQEDEAKETERKAEE